MIVDALREYYDGKAAKRKQTGWPTGSRFGTCTAQLQLLRYPDLSKPEPFIARRLIGFEFAQAANDWLAARLETIAKERRLFLAGLREEPFFVGVPLESEESAELQARIGNRSIWGRVWPGFIPPHVREVEGGRPGRPKIRLHLLPCDRCVKEGHDHSWPCGKRVGFVLDPEAQVLWAPTYVDYIGAEPDGIGLCVVEVKDLSDWGFRETVLGQLDYGRLCQLAGEAEATGLPVVLVGFRKQTRHMVELIFTRTAERTKVAVTLMNGQTEVYFIREGTLVDVKGEAAEFPCDEEWQTAAVTTPFRPGLLDGIRNRIKTVLLTDPPRFVPRNGLTLFPGVRREWGPDFACQICQGTGTQTYRKGSRTVLLKEPKPCEECKGTGFAEETDLHYPCSWCPVVVSACYPFARLEFEGGKPHYRVTRQDWEASGLTFTPLDAVPVLEEQEAEKTEPISPTNPEVMMGRPHGAD